MNPIILFRKDISSLEEFKIASEYFVVYENRCEIPERSLVIPRYSALPFYNELDIDLRINNSILINSYNQHRWIANFEYYDILEKYTFKTWFSLKDLPDNKSFVVKGSTNSKKHSWNTKMFAKNKKEAIKIYRELSEDSLIGQQDIIFREYVPLVTYEIGINGLPFTNEWRFFFYKENLISYGYYWSIAEDIDREIDLEALSLAKEIANICSDYVNFFVLDIAQKEDGSWVLVEVNDGSMSGLSCIDSNIFYKEFSKLVSR